MIKEKIRKLLGIFLMSELLFLGIIAVAFVTIRSQRYGHGFLLGLAGFEAALIGSVLLLVVSVLIGIGVAVYHDAKQRGMEPLLWALVAALVPYFLGLIAFLIVRHPVQSYCAACGQSFAAADIYCKNCGQAVQTRCPSCGRPAETSTRFCSGCGTQLEPAPVPGSGKPVVL
jgi:hypothetical protein